MELIRLLQKELKIFDESILSLEISPGILEFEKRVQLLCFHCMHYNTKWTCPPRIPDIDYNTIINEEYKNGLVIYCKMSFNRKEFTEVRYKSTNLVHKALLHLEKVLFDHNVPMAVSFIGGSCKLCKNECAVDKCRNPYTARIPIEAVGINVVSSFRKIGIEIKFPVTDVLNRYGLLLW